MSGLRQLPRADLEYEIVGSGPTVMLPFRNQRPESHYRSLDPLREAFIRTLANRYRLILFDYPAPTPRPRHLTPQAVTADLLHIADITDTGRFAWVGYSWTAVVGLQLAIRTERVTHLVMGGFPPVGGPYRAVLSYLTEIIQPENLRSLRATFDLPVTEADYQQFITYYQCLQDFNERMELARLRCRRLCVIGDADRITTPSGADIDLVGPVLDNRDELADLGWDVRMVKDADHEQAMAPDVFPEVVSLWLDANQPARPGS